MGFYQKPEQKETRRENSLGGVPSLIWDDLECLKNRNMADVAPVQSSTKRWRKRRMEKSSEIDPPGPRGL